MKYQELNNFVLRVPLYAFGYITDTLQKDGFNTDCLREILTDPIFSEALYIAAPEFFLEAQKWQSRNLHEKKLEDKIIISLIKYASRLESRATPFGLFAGCNVGNFSDKTDVILSSLDFYRSHTRLDMNYLCELSQYLSNKSEIKFILKFIPNSSLYSVGNCYRYVEYIYNKNRRKHKIVSIQKSKFIEIILKRCQTGASFFDLVNSILIDDITYDEALSFIDDLIKNQVLVSNLEISTTGEEPLNHILKVLGEAPIPAEDFYRLKNITAQIATIEKQHLGIPLTFYTEIKSKIQEIGTTFDQKFLFQSDLIVSTEKNTLSRKIPNEVLEVISLLFNINRYEVPRNLKKFIELFVERYDQSEIPLVEALDTELGIGYASLDALSSDVNPLFDDLNLPLKYESVEFEMKWNPWHSFLQSKYWEAIKNNSSEIKLNYNELREWFPLKESEEEYPSVISVMIQIPEAVIENDEYKILIKSISCVSGAALLGRFCHGDGKIHSLVNEIIKIENDSACNNILAEIVHLPESRTGNVLLRPTLRDFEIPYLARSSVKNEFQIKLNDLLISVKDNRIVLRSKQLNRQIIPKSTNAHNFSYNSLPIYNFLCDLQFQGIKSASFSWGYLANMNPFLPRVTLENIILSPSKWTIKTSDIKPFFDNKEGAIQYHELKNWRIKNKIPQFVLLSDGDNELFINMEVMLFLKVLWSSVKNRTEFNLEEFLYSPKKSLVKGPYGSYSNEVILFYKKII